MAIIVHNNSNYVATSTYHLRDKSLSLQAMGLLSFMLSCSESFKFSIEGLSYISSCGNRATRSALQELRDKGYVVVRPLRNGNRISEWNYHVFERPQDAHNEDVQFQDVQNEHLQNEHAKDIISNTSITNNSNKEKSIEGNPPISPKGTCERDTLADEKAMFDIFRRTYRGTKRGLDTEFSNFIKKHKDWREVLPTLSDLYAKQCEQLDRNKLTGGFVPQPKNLQTYINQRCWEEEVQPTTPTLHGHRQINSKFANPDETMAAILAGANAGLTERMSRRGS